VLDNPFKACIKVNPLFKLGVIAKYFSNGLQFIVDGTLSSLFTTFITSFITTES